MKADARAIASDRNIFLKASDAPSGLLDEPILNGWGRY
jgi:hypothetical protein